MNLKIGSALLFALTVFSLSGFAEENETRNNPDFTYNSSTSLSLVMVRGNNKTLSFSFDTDQNIQIKKNRLNLKGRFIDSSSNGNKKAEIYYSHLKYDREISNCAYLLGFVRYERNKLAGYNSRIALSAGGGCTWIKQKKAEVSSELAVGWNNERNKGRVSINNAHQSSSLWQKTISSSFISSIVDNKIVYRISKNSQLRLQETVFFNLEEMRDFRVNSYSAITVAISPNFALQTSFQLIYEHESVPGYKNTDMYLLSSLVIKL